MEYGKEFSGCPELNTGEYQVPKLKTDEYHVIEQLTLTTLSGEVLPANFDNDYQPIPDTVNILDRTRGYLKYQAPQDLRTNVRHVPGIVYCNLSPTWKNYGSYLPAGIPPYSLYVEVVWDLDIETENIIEYSEVYIKNPLQP